MKLEVIILKTTKELNKPLATFPAGIKDYIFNVYYYRLQLVGVIEDPKFLQLHELDKYLTPTSYIDWRFSVHWPAPILDVYGKPLKNEELLQLLYQVSAKTGWPLLTIKSSRKYF